MHVAEHRSVPGMCVLCVPTHDAVYMYDVGVPVQHRNAGQVLDHAVLQQYMFGPHLVLL